MDEVEAEIIRNRIKDGVYPVDYKEDKKRGLRRKCKQFFVKDLVLYHRKSAKESSTGQRVIIGEQEKNRILEAIHYGSGGGHFGMNKTFHKVSEQYWWKSYETDVRDFVKKCEICQKAKLLNKPTPTQLHPIPVNKTLGLFNCWCIDLVGPLNVTKNENRYIVVATEYLTGWAETKAIPNKDAVSVANFIKEIINRFGAMEILQHNQGTDFCNNLNQYLCQAFNVNKRISSAYHPQTNGLIERYNQRLCTQLQKFINEKKADNWDQFIDDITFAYRCSVQKSTKKTPFELMYGVKARLPVELGVPIDNNVTSDEEIALTDRLPEISFNYTSNLS